MAAVALPEVRGADPLVSEHPDPELVSASRAMRELPPADFRPVSGRGTAGRIYLSCVVGGATDLFRHVKAIAKTRIVQKRSKVPAVN